VAGWRDWFAGKPDRTRRRQLRSMLLDRRFSLRSLDQLSERVGLDKDATRKLLVDIDARPDERNPEMSGFDYRIRRAARRK
jgi:hypothetical protein